MLLRAGYDYVTHASLEHIVEENKDLYYKALRRTQTMIKTDSLDWEPWLRFFLRTLKKQKNNLEFKVEQGKSNNDVDLPTLSVKVLELFDEHERLTISEIVQITGANQKGLSISLNRTDQASLPCSRQRQSH